MSSSPTPTSPPPPSSSSTKEKKKNSIFGSLFGGVRRNSKNSPLTTSSPSQPESKQPQPSQQPDSPQLVNTTSTTTPAKPPRKIGSNTRQQVTSLRITRGNNNNIDNNNPTSSLLTSTNGPQTDEGDELFRLISNTQSRQRCESDPTPEFASSLEKDFGFEESTAPQDAVQILVRVASKQDIVPADADTRRNSFLISQRRGSFNQDSRVSANRRSLQTTQASTRLASNTLQDNTDGSAAEAGLVKAATNASSAKLKAATLDRLVEYVVTSPEFMETSQVSGFLLTYHSYVDAHGLLAAMASRFDVASSVGDVVAQVRTLFVLQKWIDEHWYDFAEDELLLLGVARFAKSRLDALKAAPTSSPSPDKGVIQLLNKLSTVEAMAKSLQQQQNTASPTNTTHGGGKEGGGDNNDDSGDEELSAPQQPTTNEPPPTTKFKSQQQFKFLSKNPPPAVSKDWPAPMIKSNGKPFAVIFSSTFMQKIEIARQLTLIEHALYKKITPTELVAQATHKAENPPENVRNLINHFNQVTRFVAATICYYPEVKDRAYAYRKWLKIGLSLLLLNNYNGLFEVMAGIHSVAIWRLKATKAALPNKVKKLQEQLEAAVSRRGNYATYRELLARNTVPVMPSVPFIGAALADLSFLEIGHDDTLGLDQKGDAIINFTKHRKVAEVIQLMKKFQDHPYALEPVMEIQTFLDKEIHRPDKVLDDRDLFAMSQVCEPGPGMHRGSSSEQPMLASPKNTAWS